LPIPIISEMSAQQIVAVAVILLVFFGCLRGLHSDNSFLNNLSANATTVLTSLGIFFTFFGILIALSAFDATTEQGITNSISPLLNGLKLAFTSSVLGLGCALVFRFLKPLFEKEKSSDEISAKDLLSELQQLNEGMLSVKDALVGDGDSSLSTQFSKLRNDFRDFADKVAENGSNALIEALEKVIADFNEKINEQFGENFAQLNEAVAALLVWQQEHKEQVRALTEAFTETQRGIEIVKTSVETIESSTASIPEQMDKIQEVFQATDNRMVELHEGLSGLSEMRQQATDALPFIEGQITNMTAGLEKNVTDQLGFLKERMESSEQIFTKQQGKFEGVVDSMNLSADQLLESTQKVGSELENITQNFGNSITKSTEEFGSHIQEILTNFEKEHSGFSDSIRSTMNDTGNRIQEILEQSVQNLDESMQQEIQRCLDSMGNSLTAITAAFVETYEPFSKRVAALMRTTGDQHE